jgi:hypothetical protein
MGLNAMLATQAEPDARYGRNYMEHLLALADDATAPSEAREAASTLHRTAMPGGQIVLLRTPGTEPAWIDAARTVIAHAYVSVVKSE